MGRTRLFSGIALLISAIAISIALWNRGEDDRRSAAPATPQPREVGEPVEPGTTGEPITREPQAETKREPKHEETATTLLLPNGQRVPALNGVRNPPPLKWRKKTPFSPIVRKTVDDLGNEWYLHADGSQSTTVMVFRPDLGRHDAVTRIAHPVDGETPPPIKRDGDGR